MNCFSCDQPAINACKRCSKTYCEDHGNATYCADCLKPASAMPSFNLYRGSLLVLLIGTAVAVLLLVRPPSGGSSAPDVTVARVTPTADTGGDETAQSGTPPQSETEAPGESTPEPTAGGAETPDAGTPGTGGTPSAEDTPAAGETPTVTFREYVVQEGDTLFSIAENNMPPGDDLVAYVDAIAVLNSATPDTLVLVPGETIILPPLP
jgi:hypothetical protein